LADVSVELNLAIRSPAPSSNLADNHSDEAEIMLTIIGEGKPKCPVTPTRRAIELRLSTADGRRSDTIKRKAVGWTPQTMKPNLAIKSPATFSNFDFDDSDEADIMLRIIEDLNLKCRVMRTDRGIHVWFRTPGGTGSPTKKRNALGLTQDIRGWDVNSLSTVKLNGKWREWIRDIPWEEVEEAPVWLKIVHGQRYKDEFDFPNMGEGSRNDALFRYSGVLQTR